MTAELIGGPQLSARLRAIDPSRTGQPMMELLGAGVVRESIILAPHRTGNLQHSIHVSEVTPTSVTVVASANYAASVEKGHRAFDVVPRTARVLAWAATKAGTRLTGSARKGAAMAFAMRVHIPAQAPHPFLEPGAREAIRKSGLLKVIIERWDSAA